MADSNGHFSHVGLVDTRSGAPMVIHATPAGGVRIEPVETFLSGSRDVALRRFPDLSEATSDLIASTAASYQGRPFDDALDLTSDVSLYCTELVWLSYRRAGIELVDRFETISIPLAQKEAILPSQFLAEGPLVFVPDLFLPYPEPPPTVAKRDEGNPINQTNKE